MFSNKIMSNSELFLVRECREETEFDFLLKPVAEFQDQELEEKNQEWCECKESCSSSSSSTESMSVSLEDRSKVIINDDDDDDDDGFKTPESLDHKIPVIKICPPAPRKTKILSPFSTKRKASSNVRRNLQLDLCREVELLFPRPVLADFYNKIKKARRDPAN